MAMTGAAFERLYDEHSSRVYATAYRILRDSDTAADVTQESFLRAYTTDQELANPRAWLVTVATNLSLKHIQRRARVRSLEVDEPSDDETGSITVEPADADADPARDVAASLEVSLVLRLADELRPEQRAALFARYVDELPIEEIAAAFGKTVNATTVLLHRARHGLRDRYAEHVFARRAMSESCRARRDALVALADGDPVADEVREHVASCSICRETVDELRSIGRAMALVPPVLVPATLKGTILSAAAHATAGAGAGAAAGAGSSSAASAAAHASGAGLKLGSVAIPKAVAAAAVVLVAGSAIVAVAALGPGRATAAAAPTLVAANPTVSRQTPPPASPRLAVGSAAEATPSPVSTSSPISYGPVVVWGDSLHGLAAPRGLTGVVKVAAGFDYVVALKRDGTIVAWGDGATKVKRGLTNLADISSTGASAVTRDGTLVDLVDPGTPIFPRPALANVADLMESLGCRLVLHRDGTVESWPWATPPLRNVKSIWGGDLGCYALMGDGTVDRLQHDPDFEVHVTPIPGLTGIVALDMFADHGYAVTGDGHVIEFGYDYSGPIGGAYNFPATVTPVPELSGIVEVVAGVTSGCYLALDRDGGLHQGAGCGAMDDGDVSVPAGLPRVTHIFGGWGTFAALTAQ